MLQTPAVLLAAAAAARPAATARRRSHPTRRTAPPAEWFTGAVGRPTPRPTPRPRPRACGSAAGRCVACAADGPLMWFCAVRRRSGARSVCRGVCWAFRSIKQSKKTAQPNSLDSTKFSWRPHGACGLGEVFKSLVFVCACARCRSASLSHEATVQGSW